MAGTAFEKFLRSDEFADSIDKIDGADCNIVHPIIEEALKSFSLDKASEIEKQFAACFSTEMNNSLVDSIENDEGDDEIAFSAGVIAFSPNTFQVYLEYVGLQAALAFKAVLGKLVEPDPVAHVKALMEHIRLQATHLGNEVPDYITDIGKHYE